MPLCGQAAQTIVSAIATVTSVVSAQAVRFISLPPRRDSPLLMAGPVVAAHQHQVKQGHFSIPVDIFGGAGWHL